ncbi:hypothetical protein ACFXD5_23650 [Streptomyces sp. NPDC059385]
MTGKVVGPLTPDEDRPLPAGAPWSGNPDEQELVLPLPDPSEEPREFK